MGYYKRMIVECIRVQINQERKITELQCKTERLEKEVEKLKRTVNFLTREKNK